MLTMPEAFPADSPLRGNLIRISAAGLAAIFDASQLSSKATAHPARSTTIRKAVVGHDDRDPRGRSGSAPPSSTVPVEGVARALKASSWVNVFNG
jgi:hypothetical protein